MSYKKIASIDNLFLQKDVYLFESISHITKFILLFSCIVILPLLFLINQISFDTSAPMWLNDIALFLLTAIILIIIFAVILKTQVHFFQKNTLKELSTLCNTHFIQKYSLFSPKYFATFAFDTRTVVLGSHHNHTYLIKSLNDLTHWKIIHYFKKTSKMPNVNQPKQQKFSVLTLYFKETIEREEKSYMFTFKLPLLRAKFWEKTLQEHSSQTQNIQI